MHYAQQKFVISGRGPGYGKVRGWDNIGTYVESPEMKALGSGIVLLCA